MPCNLVTTTDRAAVGTSAMNEWIDLAIPRGGEGLIRRVPRGADAGLKHYKGNCHVYVEKKRRPGHGGAHCGQRQVSAARRL